MIHMIGNAHLDPVWLWRWQEGLAEVKATFRSALDRMEEFPDYHFTSACAAYYEWIEQNAPELFEQIQRRVAEGRWHIVGGWYIQPDCNIPCGESFVRHGLYSQRYFQDKFGVMAKVGYNVDSFGHNGMLPQILKKSGMDFYVFLRPQPHEKQLEASLFRWESPDGSQVTAFRIPGFYNSQPEERERILRVAAQAEDEKNDLMCFFGVGNHGGGAAIQTLQLIQELQKEFPGTYRFSSPNAYFDAEKGQRLPLLRDELQHHAVGCYSAQAEIKALNREGEHTLMTAEKLAAASQILFQTPYPYEEMKRAWKGLLFNQFHDILGGCSIKEAYTDAKRLYGEVLTIGQRQSNFALQKLSWNIDTSGGMDLYADKQKDWKLWEAAGLGTPIVVYNPLTWPITAAIPCGNQVAAVTDHAGAAVPCQLVRASETNCGQTMQTLFQAQIPAMGYRVYRLFRQPKNTQAEHRAPYSCKTAELENQSLRVTVEKESGCISRIFDKRSAKEILCCFGSQARVMDEFHCDTWAHGESRFDKVVGMFRGTALQKIEEGPVRTVIRTVSHYQQSELRQDFILEQGKDLVEVRCKVFWREKHKLLKLAFSAGLQECKAVCEIPYGSIVRNTEGTEEPCQQWIDLQGRYGAETYGLAVLNDGKYAYDAKENVFSLTCLRSPIYADHYGQRDALCEFSDQGEHAFRYALCPHKGTFAEGGVVKKAYEFQAAPLFVTETFHKGELPEEQTGIRISADAVIATVFKAAEEENGWILRCYETAGQEAVSCTVELPLLSRTWHTVFSPYEIKTFFISNKLEEPVRETDLLESV